MARFYSPGDIFTAAKVRIQLELPLHLGGRATSRGTSPDWKEISGGIRVQLGGTADPNVPDGTFGLECNAELHGSGTGQIRLFDVTSSSAVAGSAHTVSGRIQQIESLTLASGHQYILQYRRTSNTGGVTTWGGRIRQSYA